MPLNTTSFAIGGEDNCLIDFDARKIGNGESEVVSSET